MSKRYPEMRGILTESQMVAVAKRDEGQRALLRRALAMLEEWEWASREDATWAGACPSCSAPRNPTYTPGAPDADHARDCPAEQLRRDLRAALGEGE